MLPGFRNSRQIQPESEECDVLQAIMASNTCFCTFLVMSRSVFDVFSNMLNDTEKNRWSK